MPELPDITIYIEALRRVAGGQKLDKLQISDPFVLRSVDPAPDDFDGHTLVDVSRLGKRIILSFSGDLHVVIHLMIAGRLQWRAADTKPLGRSALASLCFSSGTLVLTEAGSTRRASIHLAGDTHQMMNHDPGGLEVLETNVEGFRCAITRERQTL